MAVTLTTLFGIKILNNIHTPLNRSIDLIVLQKYTYLYPFGKHPVPLRTALHEVHEKFKFICNQSSAMEVCIISETVRSTNQLCKFCAEKKKQYLS